MVGSFASPFASFRPLLSPATTIPSRAETSTDTMICDVRRFMSEPLLSRPEGYSLSRLIVPHEKSSMTEVADAGEDHGETVLIAGGDRLLVADTAAGLHDRA